MNIYVLCSALLVILYFVLAFNVSRLRGSLKIGIGSGDHHSGILNRSIRAHGNAAEFIPIFVVMFPLPEFHCRWRMDRLGGGCGDGQ